MISGHKSPTFKILLFGRVTTFEVARPNVKPAVRRAAEVENTIKDPIRAVRNGAKISNAGSKVIIVVAAAESAFHISSIESRKALFSATQLGGRKLSSSRKALPINDAMHTNSITINIMHKT